MQEECLPLGDMERPEEPDWTVVEGLAAQQEHLSAIAAAIPGLPRPLRVRAYALLGNQLEGAVGEAVLARAKEEVECTEDMSDRVRGWLNLYDVTHDPAVPQNLLNLQSLIVDEHAVQKDQLFHDMAVGARLPQLAERIDDPLLRASALVSLAYLSPADLASFERAVAEGRAQQDTELLARVSLLRPFNSLTEELHGQRLGRPYDTARLFATLHAAGRVEDAEALRASNLQRWLTFPGAKQVSDAIQEVLAEAPHLEVDHAITDPALRTIALLAPTQDVHVGRRTVMARTLIDAIQSPHAQAIALVRLAEITDDPDDKARLVQVLLDIDGYDRLHVQDLEERVVRLTGDPRFVMRLPPPKRPGALGKFAQKSGDSAALEQAYAELDRLAPGRLALVAQHELAVAIGDHELASTALRQILYRGVLSLGGQLALHGIESSMPFAMEAAARLPLYKPDGDTAQTRQRMRSVASLVVHKGFTAVAALADNSASTTMAAQVWGTASKHAPLFAGIEGEVTIHGEAKSLFRRAIDERAPSAAVGALAEGLVYGGRYHEVSSELDKVSDGPLYRRLLRTLHIVHPQYATLRMIEQNAMTPHGLPTEQLFWAKQLIASPFGDLGMSRITEALRRDYDISPERQLQVAQAVHELSGALLDGATLYWVMTTNFHGLPVHNALREGVDPRAALEPMIAASEGHAAAMESSFDAMGLARQLLDNAEDRYAYFVARAGRTKYRTTPCYIPRRLERFLHGSTALEVDPDAFKECVQEVGLSSDVAQRLQEGRPVVDQPTWYVETAAPVPRPDPDAARQFHEDLCTVLQGYHSVPSLDSLGNLLGEQWLALISGESYDPAVLQRELEPARQRILQHMRQLQAQEVEDSTSFNLWDTYITQVESKMWGQLPIMAARVVLGDAHAYHQTPGRRKLLRQARRIFDALQTKEEQAAPVFCRMLDKRTDLLEYSRFTDVIPTCFSSLYLSQPPTERDEAFDRIWRDPCSFAIQIEAGDGPARQAVGFTFGSFGLLNEQPTLFLNGIHLTRQSTRRAMSVLESIARRVAEPLGIKQVAFATYMSSTFKPDDRCMSAEGMSMLRLSAIARQGSAICVTYDDLGIVVNLPDTANKNTWVYRW